MSEIDLSMMAAEGRSVSPLLLEKVNCHGADLKVTEGKGGRRG